MPYRVTVDTGGTFSDFVYLNEETDEVTVAKLPSTPDDPSRAILCRRRGAARASA
jgi:N-methylhydantoinase A